jgi:sulfite reductase beta subunit-like hemoprotein
MRKILSDFMAKKYSCSICNNVVKTCGRLGDRKFCEQLANEMYAEKITPEQFIAKIKNKFGKKFDEEFKGV